MSLVRRKKNRETSAKDGPSRLGSMSSNTEVSDWMDGSMDGFIVIMRNSSQVEDLDYMHDIKCAGQEYLNQMD